MRFGAVPLALAGGATLAHSVTLPGGRLRQGRVLAEGDLATLAAAGIAEVVVARLEADDVAEDAAAPCVARACVPDPGAARIDLTAPFTGRVNFHAAAAGILEADRAAIDAINRADPAITLATLPPSPAPPPAGWSPRSGSSPTPSPARGSGRPRPRPPRPSASAPSSASRPASS